MTLSNVPGTNTDSSQRTLRLARLAVVIAAAAAVAACGDRFQPDPYDVDFDVPRSEPFAQKLSEYALYGTPAASLLPGRRVIPYELSSALFTDYAYKQRLLRVPEGRTIAFGDEATLVYPEGTTLAKTFYYPSDMRDEDAPVRIIETRLLVMTEGVWNVATYLWNEEQTDATLLLDGTTIPVSWIDEAGQSRTTKYVVPHEGECVTCHQSNGSTAFIGPTPRNLSRVVERGGEDVNQLAYFEEQGLLDERSEEDVAPIVDYEDTSQSVAERARAYLDINCAHCHNPDGWNNASRQGLDLRFSTPVGRTGLSESRRAIVRHLENGSMPYLGTTLIDEQGVGLVFDYLDTLEARNQR